MKTSRLLAMSLMLACSSLVFADATALKKSDGILVTADGMTVYTFDKDAAGSGKSVCNGGCATNWPPVAVPAAQAGTKMDAPYSVVTRDDGSAQLAYKGKPLYRFAADAKAGDRNGDNVKNIWHVVKD
jgi:predicted lipoprotein with Yx(FWY)xxD motif